MVLLVLVLSRLELPLLRPQVLLGPQGRELQPLVLGLELLFLLLWQLPRLL